MLFHYFFHLIPIFSLHCQLFLLISGYYTTCNIKITYQCKIIIVPEEGWFGQPKYIVHLQKRSLYVVSTSAFIFFILYVKPIRSLLIQRTPAGSSFRLFALTFYSQATQNFIRVAGYVELSSVPFTQTSQIFKMIFLYCKAFPASEKTKLSSAHWYLFKTAHELAKTKPSLRAPRNKPIAA